MRIVEVRPGEPRALAGADPLRGRPEYSVGPAFDQRHIAVVGPRAVAIVVDVEAVVQPESRVEHERADERARPIAGCLQRAGEGRALAVEAERAVVADAVHVRPGAGHDRRV